MKRVARVTVLVLAVFVVIGVSVPLYSATNTVVLQIEGMV